MSALSETLLSIEDLSLEVQTRSGPAAVVEGVDLDLKRGEILGIVGESGSGKSLTMLNLVRLLPNKIRANGGRAMFQGRDLMAMSESELQKIRGSRIGFVFQDPMTSLNPVLRIGDQLAEPLRYHQRMSRKDARARGIELLRLVGIPAPEQRIDAYPHELSGGMRQRVMIAIGLACEPDLLIADEPTTALDVTIQAQIVELVKELRDKTGTAVIWITHDLALVAGLADRIAVLYAGTVVEEAPVDALFSQPAHPYTRGLLGSLPRMEAGSTRLPSIPGLPPEPGKRGRGCPFVNRCVIAEARCEGERPALTAVDAQNTRHRAACFVTARQQGAGA